VKVLVMAVPHLIEMGLFSIKAKHYRWGVVKDRRLCASRENDNTDSSSSYFNRY
jgi:hypothetical protein